MNSRQLLILFLTFSLLFSLVSSQYSIEEEEDEEYDEEPAAAANSNRRPSASSNSTNNGTEQSTTERLQYISLSINNIIQNAGKGNLTGIVDQALNIRVPPPIRDMVNMIVSSAFGVGESLSKRFMENFKSPTTESQRAGGNSTPKPKPKPSTTTKKPKVKTTTTRRMTQRTTTANVASTAAPVVTPGSKDKTTRRSTKIAPDCKNE